MQALGLSKSKKETQDIMEVADRDGSGQIDMEEFMGLMASMINARPLETELQKAFKRYDMEDRGVITYDDLF